MRHQPPFTPSSFDELLRVGSTTPTIGEYADYANFSSMVVATAIDPVVENVAKEFGYGFGQSVCSVLRAVHDTAASIDPSVAVELPATSGTVYTTPTNSVLRSATMSLAGRSVLPFDKGLYAGVIHPFALGDVLADNSNNGRIDILKHTSEGLSALEELGSVEQAETSRFPIDQRQLFQDQPSRDEPDVQDGYWPDCVAYLHLRRRRTYLRRTEGKGRYCYRRWPVSERALQCRAESAYLCRRS